MTESSRNTKTALITGGARRIGANIAKSLHQQGYNIIVHYNHSKNDADSLVNSLLTMRVNSAIAIQADLQQLNDLDRLSESATKKWGRVDLLINNASCFYPTPITSKKNGNSSKINDWNTIIDTNLRAPYFLSLSLADELRKVNGTIINLVDIYSERPLKNHSVYNISKAGIAMMTQTLARELAPEIRVNGVSPGAILWPEHGTPEQDDAKQSILSQTPMARCGNPKDICEAVCYLAASSFVTGQIIKVDGGRSLHI